VWRWRLKHSRITYRVLAVLCTILSLLIVYSEVILPVNLANPDIQYSVFGNAVEYFDTFAARHVRRCAVLCCAVLCCAVLCCAVLCCAVLCCAVLCCAVALPLRVVRWVSATMSGVLLPQIFALIPLLYIAWCTFICIFRFKLFGLLELSANQ
jgi:hypothetical protein